MIDKVVPSIEHVISWNKFGDFKVKSGKKCFRNKLYIVSVTYGICLKQTYTGAIPWPAMLDILTEFNL